MKKVWITIVVIAVAIMIALISGINLGDSSTGYESVAKAQDATVPDVENLTIKEIGNNSITLSWDVVPEATGYTIFYGTRPVEDNEEYNRPPLEVTNITSYKVDKLSNGVTYYFSVVAMRGAEHSEYYSNEVSAMPSNQGDLAAPTIVSVNPLSAISFEIVFSKPMQIPANAKAEISVSKAFDETALMVQSVTQTAPEKITIITESQSMGSEYRLSLTDKFLDLSGVAISPIERSDVFIGFSGSAEAPVGASGAGDVKISEIKNVTDSSIEVVFSKGVKLGDKPTDQIAIVESGNPDVVLNVKEVVPNSNEANKILIITDKQKTINYTLLVTGITDEAGLSIDQANSTFSFNGFGEGSAAQPETDATQGPTETSEPEETPTSELPDTGPGGVLLALFGASMIVARKLVRV